VSEAEQEIRALLGIAPKAPARLLHTLTPGIHPKTSAPLEKTSPTLRRLEAEYAVAELTLLREIRKQYPDIALGPQFEREDDQSKIGIAGAIPIPILNSNKGGIATARAERELARAAYETGIERLEGRLATLRARLTGTRAARTALESNVVPLVDRQLTDAQRLVELGEGGSLVLLESLTRAHQAKLDLIEALHDERSAENEIRHLLGPPERGL
jgi:cobalt-zinc-cadmium efflux system outer membrane protein